ncbi:hypothetical protein CANARDRAFT_196973 [[Candida] arabinofermentans NRRL YB-2248]|uniref:Uncharacterized protein n=1 Tax=[Candida] arabinofermentans NRRL YB-2248 TaxID=983967 RepID=A0A1E4T383_9ASCO|nr:hypothetical protein CANARDRAFT_196973 [[Candida] arabinofermentans NRRL YB-2248]
MSSGDDQLLQAMELDAKLDKIRSQVNSKLENQQQLALILQAIDENLKEQNQNINSVAYFISFLTLLDQCCINDEIKDLNMATCSVYFLDLIAPYTPKTLLKSKFSEILTKLAPTLTNSESNAPLLRSSIGILETLLLVQDMSAWINSNNYKISPKRGLTGLLELSLDPRPKVRKRAQESVNKILSTVPAGPSLEHPASHLCGEFSLNSIISLIQEQQQNQKNNNNKNIANKESNSQIIHNLQLITSITNANSWPITQISPLCDVLLEISKTSDQYLVSSSFGAFEGLFQSMNNEIDNDKFIQVLNVMFDLKPSLNDQHLAPSWLAVIAKAIISYSSNVDSFQCFLKLPQVFKIVCEFFNSQIKEVYISASQCLIAIVTDSINDLNLLSPPSVSIDNYEKIDDSINEISELLISLLNGVKFRHCAKEICELIAVLFDKLKTRCNPDFIPLLEIIGEWRSNELDGFELNTVSENVIGIAISSIGPEVVLQTLPLNLNKPNEIGRAWLLPILKSNVRNAKLNYYIKEILPLVEFFESKINNLDSDSINSKIFNTIISQIWSLLPHFMDLPSDLIESFTDEFASKLAQLLYEKVELRTVICHGLRLLVESNLAYSQGALENPIMNQQFPIEISKKNIDYLSNTIASKLLSVLFNVFSQTPMEQRNYVLETIDIYLQISKPEDLAATFDKVCSILKKALDDEKEDDLIKNDDPMGKSKIPKLSITMMDLIVLMAKYVPTTCHNALFVIFNQTIKIQDVQIQKRSYRLLTKLVETESGLNSTMQFISNILEILLETSSTTLTASKATRLNLILSIVKQLPSDYLHFIPVILSEIIISTKSVNEKTRESSYQILIAMGSKMIEFNGVPIKNSLNDKDMPDSIASLEEFFTMCSAGLVGATPNMVSAAITSISCLLYEYHSKISTDYLVEINSTVELFLTSKNREIIKSTLGFLKVSILSLPEDITTSNMKSLLTNLLMASHEHKNHFKSKIKHIIERLIRKFGVELIEECIPEQDKKLVMNIKKSKARAKKKKIADAATSTVTGTGSNSKPLGDSKFMSGYDAALYGDSDSEFEDDESDDEFNKPKNNNNRSQQYISESRDQPLDLLDKQTLSHISSSKPKKFTKKSFENGTVSNSSFKTKNGKLVINENGISENNGDDDNDVLGKNSIDAYVEAVKQGPVRGQKNRLKFDKKEKGDGINWDDEDGDRRNGNGGGRGGFRGGRGGRGGSRGGSRGGFRGGDRGGVRKPQGKFRGGKKF